MKAVTDAYTGERVSEHIIADNKGGIICTCPIARSGFQTYRHCEIEDGGDNTEVQVFRPPEEVRSKTFLASLEGAVLTNEHPESFVDARNWNYVAKGHVQNAFVGPNDDQGNVTVWADLHVKDQQMIDLITSGKKDVSVGYLYRLEDERGRPTMRSLLANHVAVVQRGRSGSSKIIDSAPEDLINLAYLGPRTLDRWRDGIRQTAAQIGESFENLVKKFHRKPALDVLPHSDNKESPLLTNELATDDGPIDEPEIIPEEDDMANSDTQALLQRLCAAVEGLVQKNTGTADNACTCGAEEGDTHHKRCPMAGKVGEDDDTENFRDPTPSRARGGAELIPVPSNGGEGNTNPARDQYEANCEALERLRGIRPSIVAHARSTGDRSGIDSFNLAVSGLKREIALFEKNPHMRPYQTSQRVGQDDAAMRQKQIAVDFEAVVAGAREAAMNDTHGFKIGTGSRVAVDAAGQPKEDASFDEQVRRARDKKLRG